MHAWGAANRVVFDASKEYFRILGTRSVHGGTFRLLGIDFDPKLQMCDAIHSCVLDASWRLKSILRTTRFFSDAELILHFKAHVLSYIEYRTPALYHAAATHLLPLDNVLSSFLRQTNVSDLDALCHFNLAPLSARRDMAMLGVIHRAVLRKGPSHFFHYFNLAPPTRFLRRRHSRHLIDLRQARSLCMYNNSVIGLIWVYNILPSSIVKLNTVRDFQSALQDLLKSVATSGLYEWQVLFSPRRPIHAHPLLSL